MIGEIKPNVLVMDGAGLQEFLASLSEQAEGLPAACADHEGLPMTGSLADARATVTNLHDRYGPQMTAEMARDCSAWPACCTAAGLARYFTAAAAREVLAGEG
jgi:hypothetical protein